VKKSQITEFHQDLKAAARLGHPESIEMALDGLRTMSIVAGNEQLGDGFIALVVIPAGKTLSKLSGAQLRLMLDDSQTAMRAIAGVALAQQFVMGKDVSLEMLQTPANDARPEVRTAFAQTLGEAAEAHPERYLQLAQTWLTAPSARLQNTALGFSPALGADIFQYLEPFKLEENPEVRAALVEALQALAQNGLAEQVLGLLKHWGAEPRPNVWVICRVLSGSWAATYPQEVKSILINLKEKVGQRKSILNAIKALRRHGAEIEI